MSSGDTAIESHPPERGGATQKSAPKKTALVTRRTWVWHAVMLCIHPIYTLYFRVRIRGREHLPREGGGLIISNHQSFLDIPLIAKGAFPRHVSFVARDTLAKSRVLSFIMRWTGVVLIRRGASDRAALKEIAEHMKSGDLSAIFPEGTRMLDGSLGNFKGGALISARMAKVKLYPCVIRGSHKSWPKGGSFPKPKRLEIEFLPPVDSGPKDCLERVRASIAEALGQPPSETGEGATTAAANESNPTQNKEG